MPSSTTAWLLAVGGLLLLVYLAAIVALMATGRRSDARAIAGFIPDCVVLFRRLLGDERVPRRSKVALWMTIGYLVSPLDLIPDFIPGLGQLDDAILVGLVLRWVVREAGAEVVRECWPGPEASLSALLRFCAV